MTKSGLPTEFEQDSATDLGVLFASRVSGIAFSLRASCGVSASGPFVAFVSERRGWFRHYRQQLLWQAAATDDAWDRWRQLGEELAAPESLIRSARPWPDGALWALQKFLWRSSGFHFERPLPESSYFGTFSVHQSFRLRAFGEVQTGLQTTALEPYLVSRGSEYFLALFLGIHRQGVGSMEGSRRTLVALPLSGVSKALMMASSAAR